MEEEGSINFQALRARFQEEALLAQSRAGRPAVAEKPKHLPPPGGHCSSVVSSFNTASESKSQLTPPVLSRDGLRASGGRRPISFPPQTQKTPTSLSFGGESTKRHFLRERHMPLVLPVLPERDQTAEPPARKEHKLEPEPEKEVPPQTKIKKKGLLLPFKSAKSLKVGEENGEEPARPDPTTRPCSAACELPSVEKQTAEDGVSLQSDQSTAECPVSSPDISVTPPLADAAADCDSRFMSTLEKAKKKFSCRQMLISTRPKSLRSPDCSPRERGLPSPPKCIDSTWADLPVPPPVCLPHLACISARPFFKANTSSRKSMLEKHQGRARAEHPSVGDAEPHPPCLPLKKQLPDLGALGLQPAKPTRPPVVDLSCYHAASVSKVSSRFSQASSEEPESEHPSAPNSPLGVQPSPGAEMETAEREAVDAAALGLQASACVSADVHAPVNFGVAGSGRPHADSSACYLAEAMSDVNLGSPNIIPLHPGCFPEPINLSEFLLPAVPERRSQSEEAPVDSPSKSHSDENDLPAAECQCVPEESGLASQAAWSGGIQTHSGSSQQNHDYETYDNVYEDVENIRKFMEKKSSKQQGSVKNPYAGIHTTEEPCGNKWSRNPWGAAAGEHAQPAQNHVLSKEPPSPSAADFKEHKKREKQRLEKEKKEQKEREKRENEMRKKYKVTGDEEPMYHARVTVASKVRKNDLPVKTGDTVSIIRTTNCPKGKWLARDANHKYGYISVMNVELNIKEMLELGKKAQAAGRGGNAEGDNVSIGSRSSSHLVLTSSFTDDSEEWACEDETISPSSEIHGFAAQPASALETSCVHVGAQHTLSDANLEDLHTQTRHEALQKLAIFFQHNRNELSVAADNEGATPTNEEPSSFLHAVEEPPYPEQEVDFTDLEFLPPPPLYADTT